MFLNSWYFLWNHCIHLLELNFSWAALKKSLWISKEWSVVVNTYPCNSGLDTFGCYWVFSGVRFVFCCSLRPLQWSINEQVDKLSMFWSFTKLKNKSEIWSFLFNSYNFCCLANFQVCTVGMFTMDLFNSYCHSIICVLKLHK